MIIPKRLGMGQSLKSHYRWKAVKTESLKWVKKCRKLPWDRNIGLGKNISNCLILFLFYCQKLFQTVWFLGSFWCQTNNFNILYHYYVFVVKMPLKHKFYRKKNFKSSDLWVFFRVKPTTSILILLEWISCVKTSGYDTGLNTKIFQTFLFLGCFSR